jgi:hypothetical protein
MAAGIVAAESVKPALAASCPLKSELSGFSSKVSLVPRTAVALVVKGLEAM